MLAQETKKQRTAKSLDSTNLRPGRLFSAKWTFFCNSKGLLSAVRQIGKVSQKYHATMAESPVRQVNSRSQGLGQPGNQWETNGRPMTSTRSAESAKSGKPLQATPVKLQSRGHQKSGNSGKLVAKGILTTYVGGIRHHCSRTNPVDLTGVFFMTYIWLWAKILYPW